MSEQSKSGLLGNLIWPLAAIAGVGVIAIAIGMSRTPPQPTPQAIQPVEAVKPQSTPQAVTPQPITTPTPQSQPMTAGDVPADVVRTVPEGYWVEVIQAGGYEAWNLRDKPRGEILGVVMNGTRLYTDNRIYGRWLSVLCPDTLPCKGQWVWIAQAGVKEVTPYAN